MGTDIKTISIYFLLCLSYIFFILAIFVKINNRHPNPWAKDKTPRKTMEEQESSKWFIGYMFFAGACIITSLGLTLNVKGTINTSTMLKSVGVVCSILVGWIISFKSNTSIWALALTNTAALLVTLSIELYD